MSQNERIAVMGGGEMKLSDFRLPTAVKVAAVSPRQSQPWSRVGVCNLLQPLYRCTGYQLQFRRLLHDPQIISTNIRSALLSEVR
jgi:hypothetical protein